MGFFSDQNQAMSVSNWIKSSDLLAGITVEFVKFEVIDQKPDTDKKYATNADTTLVKMGVMKPGQTVRFTFNKIIDGMKQPCALEKHSYAFWKAIAGIDPAEGDILKIKAMNPEMSEYFIGKLDDDQKAAFMKAGTAEAKKVVEEEIDPENVPF